jgi:5'-deoxynucleotidase YfbR-like HD superfamily hydrolase
VSDGRKEQLDDERIAEYERTKPHRERWDRLRTLRESGEVVRTHTFLTHRNQTIAEHVYGSLIIAMELCASVLAPRDEQARVAFTLLYHDAPERDTGDVPAPVKRDNPDIKAALDALEQRFYDRLNIGLPDLTERAQAIVHASDTLDLAFTCLREKQMGNRTPRLTEVFQNCMTYLVAYEALVPAVSALREGCWKEWMYVG